MSKVVIYHNPRCTKSRQTLNLLRENNVEPEIIEYLKQPPTRSELDHILKLLKMDPQDLIRRKDYRDLELPETDDREQLLDLMVEHPKIIERPIVIVAGKKACIGRPPENALDLL